MKHPLNVFIVSGTRSKAGKQLLADQVLVPALRLEYGIHAEHLRWRASAPEQRRYLLSRVTESGGSHVVSVQSGASFEDFVDACETDKALLAHADFVLFVLRSGTDLEAATPDIKRLAQAGVDMAKVRVVLNRIDCDDFKDIAALGGVKPYLASKAPELLEEIRTNGAYVVQVPVNENDTIQALQVLQEQGVDEATYTLVEFDGAEHPLKQSIRAVKFRLTQQMLRPVVQEALETEVFKV